MKINFLEPLGISNDRLREIVDNTIGTQHEVTYYSDRNEDPAVLVERCQGADCVVLSNMKFGRDIIEKCPELKMICVAFTGVDLVDIEYCKEKNIRVCNCAGYSTVAVADLVFGFVIDLARNVFPCNEVVRKGGTKQGLVGFELEGKTFGVVGTGAIGLRVAAIAQAFGCRVLAYSRTAKDVPGVRYVDLETLLAESDVVSLHTPLTEETRGLMNEKRIGLMKKNAVLINTARGPVVDSDALAGALKEGRIAGACIDVFENEPPVRKDHPLFSAPNTIVTPHVAFATKEALVKRAVIVFDNVVNYLDGTPGNVIG